MSYIAVTCESIVCEQHSTATLELYSLSSSLSSCYRVSVPVSPSWSTRQVRRFASAGAIALRVYHTHLLYTATLYLQLSRHSSTAPVGYYSLILNTK